MKIVHSFWSKPFLENNTDENGRYKGGWLSTRYNLYSWALSCLKFKQFYDDVELYTDQFGKELLIDKLQLPYTKVHVVLNNLDHYSSKLWALGKIYTYSLQNEPFLHADSDVYIWEKLPRSLTASPIFAQNSEVDFPRYLEVYNTIVSDFTNPPEALTEIYDRTHQIMAFNAGIIGGNDIGFFKNYTKQIFDFINSNTQNLPLVDVGILNMVYEQQLGYSLAIKENIEVNFLRQNVDASFTRVMDFHLLPVKDNYIHTVGYAKKTAYACEQIQNRLKYEFPAFYEKFNKAIANNALANDDREDLLKESPIRFSSLSQTYNFLETNSWETLLQTKFVLNPKNSIHISPDESSEESYISYRLPQNNEPEKLILNGWEGLLADFETPKSVSELVAGLLQDPDIASAFTKEALELKLFSFAMDKVTYSEILVLLN